jgi:hypothetical protein
MSNIYLDAFSGTREKTIPTPRLRVLLSNPHVVVCEENVLRYDLNKGMLPFYKLNTDMLYKAEKKYLNLPADYTMYFCTPAVNGSIALDVNCDNGLNWLNRLFGLDPENTEQTCIRYVGQVQNNKVNHFCSTWDKSFHLLQSIIRVNASSKYELTQKQKEIFSMCWAKILSTARIRMDLDCSMDIQDMGVPAPLWLQQFSKGIVVLDTPSKMISNSLVSHMSKFLDSSYDDLKSISLSMCKSFLVDIQNKPEYLAHKDKINEWIKVCDKMGSKSIIQKNAFSASLVFGIIGAVVLLKRFKKSAA